MLTGISRFRPFASAQTHDPIKPPAPDFIRDGNRFPAFAKLASAGEARSEKHALGLDPRDHAQANSHPTDPDRRLRRIGGPFAAALAAVAKLTAYDANAEHVRHQ
jgi:hypothetical protein